MKCHVFLIITLFLISLAVPLAAAANPGHSAAAVGPGTFESGDYAFPGTVNITGNLNVSGYFSRFGTGADAGSSSLAVLAYGPKTALFINHSGGGPGIHYALDIFYNENSDDRIIQARSLAGNVFTLLSSGRLGLGTETPNRKLTVAGDMNVSGLSYFDDNVSIGTAYPDARLTVIGPGAPTIAVGDGLNSPTEITGTAATWTSGGSSSAIAFGLNKGVVFSRLVSANTLVVDVNGNVGIGTNVVNQKLTVAGDLNVTGTSYLGNMIIRADSITVNNITSKDGNITFNSNTGSEKLRITSSGVGIGDDAPANALSVKGQTLLQGTGSISETLTVKESGGNTIFEVGHTGMTPISYVRANDRNGNRIATIVDGGSSGPIYSFFDDYFGVSKNVSIGVSGAGFIAPTALYVNGTSYFSGKTGIGTETPNGKFVVTDGKSIQNAGDVSYVMSVESGAGGSDGLIVEVNNTHDGIFGRNYGSSGYGIRGYSLGGSAVYGYSPNGWSGYFNGKVYTKDLTVEGNANITQTVMAANVNATNICIGTDCKTSWPSGTASPFDNSSSQIFVRAGYPSYTNVSSTLFVNGTSGNVGIGTPSPAVKLDVNDGIKLADSTVTCGSTYRGMLRFNATDAGDKLYQCMRNSTGSYIWVQVATSG